MAFASRVRIWPNNVLGRSLVVLGQVSIHEPRKDRPGIDGVMFHPAIDRHGTIAVARGVLHSSAALEYQAVE